MNSLDLTNRAFSHLVTMLEGFGNTLNSLHKAALHSLLESMTQMAEGRLQGRYAFGLPTGMGKTSAIIAWCSSLHSLRMEEMYSVAVSASKVEALCQLKRDLIVAGIPETSIGLLHSYRHRPSQTLETMLPEGYASEPSTEGADRPIMLVTHNRVRGGSLQQFNQYRGKTRSLLLYDESLIVSDSWFLPVRSLKASIGWATEFYSEDQPYQPLLSWLQECRRVILETLEQGGAIITLPTLTPSAITLYKTLLDSKSALDAVKQLLDLANLPLRIVQTGQGGVVRYQIAVPAEIKNVLVLDASQPIRKLVHLDSSIRDAETNLPSVKKLGVPLSSMKRFDRVTIYQLFSGGGRSTLEKDFKQKWYADRKISNEIVSVVKTIPPTDSILLFTYKTLTQGGVNLRRILLNDLAAAGIDVDAKINGKARLSVLTWGLETSLNHYSHCSHVILAGVLQRDPVDLAGCFVGQKDNLGIEIGRGIVEELCLSEVCHLVYQALSRGSCRVVENGHARTMTAYVIHRDEKIKTLLGEVMPGAVWKTWKAQHIKVKPGTIQTIASDIQHYLCGLSKDVRIVSTRKIKECLGFAKVPSRTFTWAIRQVVEGGRTGWILTGRSLVNSQTLFD